MGRDVPGNIRERGDGDLGEDDFKAERKGMTGSWGLKEGGREEE